MPLLLDDNTSMAAASAAGATAAMLADQSADSRVRKFCNGVSGFIVGAGAGPSLADTCGLTNDHHRFAVGIALGIAGAIVLKKVLLWLHTAELKDLLTFWIKK